MPPTLLTLIGSGETSDRLLNVHRTLLAHLENPQLVFVDTPANFQLNADEIGAHFQNYFQKNFSLPLAVAATGRAPTDSATALTAVELSNYIVAGPGSPTYAIQNWRGTVLYQKIVERFNAGAQLVFASSAVIALSHYALPVYEIYKVGAEPHWVEGLNLLQHFGLDLALIPHYDNKEGRTYDTRFCFMGEPRLHALEKLLPPATVILGLDENTAATFDFAKQQVMALGAGRVTIRYQGKEVHYREGESFPFERLTPAHAATSNAPPVVSPQPISNPQSLISNSVTYVPPKIIEWNNERNHLRAEKKFAESDVWRNRINAVGYAVKDSPQGASFTLTRYAKSSLVPTQMEKEPTCEWSVQLLAHNNRNEIMRAAQSVLHFGGDNLEVIIVDNASTDDTINAIIDLACTDERVRPLFLSENLGEGAGRNAGFRWSRGRHLMILGGHMEIKGDVFAPLAATLVDPQIGATGSNGLVSRDLFTFNPAPTVECDAVEFYLFAFKRVRLSEVGWLDEKFVFYRNLDLDWSLAFKNKGLRLVTTPNLPLAVHEHPYLRMDPNERDKLSKKNYKKFLEKWKDRKDLLLANHS